MAEGLAEAGAAMGQTKEVDPHSRVPPAASDYVNGQIIYLDGGMIAVP